VLKQRTCEAKLLALGAGLGLDDYVVSEAEYVMGRFLPSDLDSYLTVRREGRGSVPRMEKPLRERLLKEVIRPYIAWKNKEIGYDWNDLAIKVAAKQIYEYDIVVYRRRARLLCKSNKSGHETASPRPFCDIRSGYRTANICSRLYVGRGWRSSETGGELSPTGQLPQIRSK